MAKKTQIEKFREAAREHETDQDESRFDDVLRHLGKEPAGEKDRPKNPNKQK